MNAPRKILRSRLDDVRKAHLVSEVTVNRDWVQAQVLGGIARHQVLATTLVFKGGTALQKMYFGRDFRFSEDLDFTARTSAPTGEELARALAEACANAEEHIKRVLGTERVVLRCERKEEREPHPSEQEAFKIHFQMPWQDRPLGFVKLEITFAETLVIAPAARPLLVTFGDVEASVLTYALEEVVLEKLRASQQTLQSRDKRKEKSGATWLKPRSRDFYDLWHIAKYRTDCDWDQVAANIEVKCSARGVVIKSTADVFIDDVVTGVKEKWAQQLEDFVPAPLPDVEPLLVELRVILRERLGWSE